MSAEPRIVAYDIGQDGELAIRYEDGTVGFIEPDHPEYQAWLERAKREAECSPD